MYEPQFRAIQDLISEKLQEKRMIQILMARYFSLTNLNDSIAVIAK